MSVAKNIYRILDNINYSDLRICDYEILLNTIKVMCIEDMENNK